ncbi:hypothetical protein [Chelativorans salis]|uniref:Glycosyltransferase n=1 Tax=Chelativorans salis TaxID=2978478 RepID=A0ABT2LTP5_9HYPH|nr:hypothetical protein [Chelativorans sp. EGI FJ00035]MCT7376564.1 hypothetical protein [Chelativorans sp. EGI FJ00035]
MRYLFQVICVRWGSKYEAGFVNHLFRMIACQTNAPFRFLCIDDAGSAEYDEGIEVRPFPEFALPFDKITSGCRAKLAIFARGMLEDGIPALYFDLDVLVKGDPTRLVRQLRRKPGLYMLKNHYVQFWRFQRYLEPLLGDRYYFGDSSALAFYPERCHGIFDRFNALAGDVATPPASFLRTDDRFVSYSARNQVRVFPRSLVVKFADEYMAPLLIIAALRGRLPWVKRRRAGLVAVAFVSDAQKPRQVASFRLGQIVRYKRRKLRWQQPEYSAYWQDACALADRKATIPSAV